MDSPAGRLISAASNVQAALDMGFTLTLSDVSCEVFHAMKMVDSEKAAKAKRDAIHAKGK